MEKTYLVDGHVHLEYGDLSEEYVMDFVDEVLRLYPAIDAEQLGVAGGSYGGFMCNWIIGHTDRFKAACSQRSISNRIAQICYSDYGIDTPYEFNIYDVDVIIRMGSCGSHNKNYQLGDVILASNIETPSNISKQFLNP